MENNEISQIIDIRDELDQIMPRISFLATSADSIACLRRHNLHVEIGEPEWNGLAVILGEIESSLAAIAGKLENLYTAG